jgi:predicted aspartyl protease
MANEWNQWTAALIVAFVTLIRPVSVSAGQLYETSGQFQSQAVDELSFKLLHGHFVVVTGSLPGLDRKVNLVIDTGSTHTFVSRKLARRVGLLNRPYLGVDCAAFGSKQKVQVVVLKGLQLGRRLITRPCLAGDLPWGDIDIVVGVDILRQSSLTIDYEKSKLVFGGASLSEATVALENEQGLPVVPVTIKGLTVRLVVDSGAHLTSVYRESVDSWGKNAIHEKWVRVAHGGGLVPARKMAVPSVEFAGLRISQPRVVILEAENSKFNIDGFLGTASLGLKRIHLDFERRVLSAL